MLIKGITYYEKKLKINENKEEIKKGVLLGNYGIINSFNKSLISSAKGWNIQKSIQY